MENKLNVPKLEYKTGEPMWVHWDYILNKRSNPFYIWVASRC